MTLNVLFSASADDWTKYGVPLQRALRQAGVDARLAPDLGPPGEIDYIVYAPNSRLQDFTPFHRLKAVLNLWAGVDTIVGNASLTVPLVRMVDRGLTEGMVEWVAGHTLRHHLGIDRILQSQDGVWAPEVPPLARHRPVTILGLGVLGSACAQALSTLGFPVTGWSRTPRQLDGVTCLSGPAGLETALRSARILVLLLPSTPATETLLNAARLSLLPAGAVVLNPGRGPLIDDDALLSALDSGQVGHATLDVFRTEPLPPEHPYWAHPRVTVTPHIASDTRADTAAMSIAESIRQHERGAPLQNVVDRSLGY